MTRQIYINLIILLNIQPIREVGLNFLFKNDNAHPYRTQEVGDVPKRDEIDWPQLFSDMNQLDR